MQLINAFLLATAFAYLACFVYTVMGKPALVGVSNSVQMVFYLIAFAVFLFVSRNSGITALNLFLGVAYSFACVGSFIGFPQKWKAYWTSAPNMGSAAGQIGMAAWDLAIAICFFTRC